jgi:hypothetical protein
MNGTVTISLQDFEELKNSSSKAAELSNSLKLAAKELEVFLSYLITRENIDEHLEEFNAQSTTSKILLIDGKAKIKFTKDLTHKG